MKLFFALAFSMMFLITIQAKITAFSGYNETSSLQPNLLLVRDEEITFKIKFIGFDESLVNETGIEEQLVSQYTPFVSTPRTTMIYSYEFSHAIPAEENGLRNFILANAENGTGTGYKINETLMDELLANEDLFFDIYNTTGELPEIYIPADGMTIDTDLVEEYIYQNLFDEEPLPSYTMYLMNFSDFDLPDHSLEHWYTVEGADIDSGKVQNLMGWYNFTRMATAGWGGKHRFYYVDLSSRSYYLEYLYYLGALNFSIGDLGDFYFYKYTDLENFTQSFDLETTVGKQAYTDYLVDWIEGFQGNLLNCDITNYYPPIGETISCPILIFNNLTNNGYLQEDLDWVISETWIHDQLAASFPWVNWDVSINWVNINDYPVLDFIIDESTYTTPGGYRNLDLNNGLFSHLYYSQSTYFDLESGDAVLPTYLFLMDNLTLTTYGTSILGVSSYAIQIVAYNQFHLFQDGDETQRKYGTSGTTLHEIGHTIGLPHPHSTYFGWSGALVEDVMSYFGGKKNIGFSSFYRDAIGRMHANDYYVKALDEFETLIEYYQDTISIEKLTDEINLVNSTLDECLNLYEQMDYYGSIELAREIPAMLATLENEITNPSGISIPVVTIMTTIAFSLITIIWRKRRQ